MKLKSSLGLGLALTLCGGQQTCPSFVGHYCYLLGFYKPPQFQQIVFKETLSGDICCSPFRYSSVFEVSVCAKCSLLWSSAQQSNFEY